VKLADLKQIQWLDPQDTELDSVRVLLLITWHELSSIVILKNRVERLREQHICQCLYLHILVERANVGDNLRLFKYRVGYTVDLF
jgi:hypothetical protein